MNFLIREFENKDIEAITILNSDLGYPTDIETMNRIMTNIHLQPNTKTYVVEIENLVVGYIGLSSSFGWEHEDQFVRIQALSISKFHRRKGLGRSLVKKAEEWTKEIGAKFIILNSGNREERESAHQFYPSLGFEPKSIGYKKFYEY